MSIASPNIIEFQSQLRKLPNPALKQMADTLDPSDPKKLFVGLEMSSRLKAQNAAKAQQAPKQTVVAGLGAALSPKPPMPPQGMPPMPQGMPPGVPGMGATPPPQMPPQAPPQMQAGGYVHDYGVASLPYVPKYEHGGIVAFSGKEKSEVKSDPTAEYWAHVNEVGPQFNPPQKLYGVPLSSPDDALAVAESMSAPVLTPTSLAMAVQQNIAQQTEAKNKNEAISATAGQSYGRKPLDPTTGMSGEELPPAASSSSPDFMTLLNNIGASSGMGKGSSYPNLIPGIEERKQLALDYLKDAERFAPPTQTYQSIAAERKAAQGANPNYDPDYFKNRNALLEERYKEQQKGFAPSAMNNLAMALSAAGAEGSFRRGIAAFGKSINEGNVRFSKEIKDARDHFQNQKDLNDAAKQAEANNDITSAIQLKAKSEEDNRQFLAKQREAQYQALYNTSREKDAAKLSEAEYNQKQAIADRAVNLRLRLAGLSLAGKLSDREMTYAVELAKLREKGKLTPDKLAPIMAKLMPEIDEQAAQDARTLGFEFEKLPSDKQQQLRNAAGGKVRDRLLSLSGATSAVSGNTITGVTLGAPPARPPGIAGLGLGSGVVDVAAEDLGDDQ